MELAGERDAKYNGEITVIPAPQPGATSRPRIIELLRKKARLSKCRSTLASDRHPHDQPLPDYKQSAVMRTQQPSVSIQPQSFVHIRRQNYIKDHSGRPLINMRTAAKMLISPTQTPMPPSSMAIKFSSASPACQLHKLMVNLRGEGPASRRTIFSQRMLARTPQESKPLAQKSALQQLVIIKRQKSAWLRVLLKDKAKLQPAATKLEAAPKPSVGYYPGTAANTHRKRRELMSGGTVSTTNSSRPEFAESRPDSRYNRASLCSAIENGALEKTHPEFVIKRMNLADSCQNRHLLPSCWT